MKVQTEFKNLESFVEYILKQMNSCTPCLEDIDKSLILKHLPIALERMGPILKAISIFKSGYLNHLHSLQYASFLYVLANEIWAKEGDNGASEKLFLLNRSLNTIDLYFKIKLPKVFFISHGLSSVLGNATYGENLVFFQNVTVGRVGNKIPTIGNNVILYSGCSVVGNSIVGDNCVISAGTIISNEVIPDYSIAFSQGGKLVIKATSKNYIRHYLES
jgi:serine O-acetyltransferase